MWKQPIYARARYAYKSVTDAADLEEVLTLILLRKCEDFRRRFNQGCSAQLAAILLVGHR